MASGGHNRKTTEQHKAQGTYIPSRHSDRLENSVDSIDVTELPAPPQELSDEEKKYFNRAANGMANLGVLADVDLEFLTTYAKLEAKMELYENEWRAKPIPVLKDGKIERVNPLIKIMDDTRKQLMVFYDKMGFNPKARMTIKTQKKEKPKDPAALLMGAKGKA